MCELSDKGYISFRQTLSLPALDVRNNSLVKNNIVPSPDLIFYVKWASNDYDTCMGFRLESITNTILAWKSRHRFIMSKPTFLKYIIIHYIGLKANSA